MGTLSTHVLDTALGRPAAGVVVVLEHEGEALGHDVTDDDGRVPALGPGPLAPGEYTLTFEVADYHAATGQTGFYPRVRVDFVVTDGAGHLHVPLLLNPFGYSTYRGS
jgi:5-hydroxyisourate hydrolase